MGGMNSSSNHVDGGTSRFDKSGRIYHAVCGHVEEIILVSQLHQGHMQKKKSAIIATWQHLS